jgi:GDPmannose 4,6-dehydratase
MAFKAANIHLIWEGKEQAEVARDIKTGKIVMKVNPKFYRPAEVDLLIGSADKAKKELGWEPTTSLEDLCQMMVEADLLLNLSGLYF